MYQAYWYRMYLRDFCYQDMVFYPYNYSSALINQQQFSQAVRPIITLNQIYTNYPCSQSFQMNYLALFIAFIPPFMVNLSLGKSPFSCSTFQYCKGGMFLFWAGLSPFKKAFLACMTKCFTAPYWLLDTTLTNSLTNSQSQNQSTPSLHLTVTGIFTLDAIYYIHSYTILGSFIKHAPNDPSCTRGLGHPTLRFISSYPQLQPMTAAQANSLGSQPPSCNTIGCQIGLQGSTCL